MSECDGEGGKEGCEGNGKEDDTKVVFLVGRRREVEGKVTKEVVEGGKGRSDR